MKTQKSRAEAIAKATGLPLVDAVDSVVESFRFREHAVGGEFSIAEFRADNAGDPMCEVMVRELEELPLGCRARFAIGGGWGNEIERVR